MGGPEFRILGPLEVWRDGERVPVEAPRERGVLAVLLLHAGRVVAADRLIELVWADDVPPRARNTVHTLMWRLRRWLGSTLETRPPGYVLRIDPDQLDLHRFESLLQRGRQAVDAGEAQRAADLLGAALELWRGEPLTGVAADGLRRIELPRLSELYLEAVEARIEAHLLLGRHAELVGELRGLVADHPLREGLSGQLMTALYRCGRQAEALEAYRRLHAVLDEELGVEPGPALQRLHRAVLRADRALDMTRPPRPESPSTSAPAQLPADVAAFTGRSRDLGELDSLLRACESAVAIAAIAGTAGVGKTALAVHWAHRVRDRFDGGQLYVNLRGYASSEPMRPIEALSRFLRALGVPADQVPVEVEEAADLYRTLLADRRMLVVLDNARSADQVRPLLPGSAGCVVLVTSRDRLGGLVAREGAQRVPLDVLPPDEAGALLTGMLGTDRVRAEPDAAATLADSCARLPLALRIAAANLIDRPQVTLADYVAELAGGNRLAALTVDGDEQGAVRAAFDLSYTGLAADSQRLFRLLGLVPGQDFTADVAAAVAGIGVPEARRRLAGLTAAHLVDEPAAGRYTFHDLLRLYAREQPMDQAERESARRRLFEFYLSTVDSAAHLLYPEKLRLPLPVNATAPLPPGFADHAAALTWLDTERPNLVTAILDAAEHGPRQFTWLLADALRGYFYLRMFTAEWLAVAHAGLTAARTDGERQAEAAAHLSLADLDWRASRHRQAIDHYAQALTLARQTGWLEAQAATLGNLGTVYWQAGRLDEAAEHYRRALELNRRTGWLEGQAINLGNLAAVSWQAGCLDEAAEHNAQALALHRKTGSRSGEALAHNNLGETYHLMGRLAEALDQLEQARDLHRAVGNRGTEAETLRCLAAVHRDTGHLTEALELGTAALELAEETGNRRHQTEAHNNLGAVHLALGNDATAVVHYERALTLARDTNNRYSEAEALTGLASAHDRLGRPDQALVYATQALGIARRGGYRVPQGQALTCLAAIHLHRGDAGRAREHAEQALDVHTETGHRPGIALARALLATP
jgi:DNA-binding SARP family transcriptional activator/Tfp pilus assembly protein PilF